MNAESKKPRYVFLDNIKVLFTILVIFNHARVTYTGEGWWYYIELIPVVDAFSEIFFTAMTAIGGIFQPSLMGLFFLMGAYFTPKSHDRKGARMFWKDRLLRIGIPILLFVFLINPIMNYTVKALIGPAESFWVYYASKFLSVGVFVNFLTSWGPMWFLFMLLLLSACYTIWRQVARLEPIKRKIPKDFPIPKILYLFLLALGLGFVAFLVRMVSPIDAFPLGIPLGYFFQYLMMFSVGIIAYRQGWFEQMSKKATRIWSLIILAVFVLFYAYVIIFVGLESDFSVFLGGPNVNALLFALVDNVVCMGMIFVLIQYTYAKHSKQGRICRELSNSAFHMYLLHPIILALVSLGFAPLPLFPVVKMLVVLLITIALCYLASRYVLQKITFGKNKPEEEV